MSDPEAPKAQSPESPEARPPMAADPVTEAPSPDVVVTEDASPLPGTHRGGFFRLPTAPIAVTTQSAPAEPGTRPDDQPPEWLLPPRDDPHRGLSGWALAFSIAGLVVALFVGWGFPIGLVGTISAIIALRRPLESRAVAIWALVLGIVSILYSAGWLLWAALRTPF